MLSAGHCFDATVNLYDQLFNVESPSDEEGVQSFADNLIFNRTVALKDSFAKKQK